MTRRIHECAGLVHRRCPWSVKHLDLTSGKTIGGSHGTRPCTGSLRSQEGRPKMPFAQVHAAAKPHDTCGAGCHVAASAATWVPRYCANASPLARQSLPGSRSSPRNTNPGASSTKDRMTSSASRQASGHSGSATPLAAEASRPKPRCSPRRGRRTARAHSAHWADSWRRSWAVPGQRPSLHGAVHACSSRSLGGPRTSSGAARHPRLQRLALHRSLHRRARPKRTSKCRSSQNRAGAHRTLCRASRTARRHHDGPPPRLKPAGSRIGGTCSGGRSSRRRK